MVIVNERFTDEKVSDQSIFLWLKIKNQTIQQTPKTFLHCYAALLIESSYFLRQRVLALFTNLAQNITL